MRKRLLCDAILHYERIYCQDRLGTNIGKDETKDVYAGSTDQVNQMQERYLSASMSEALAGLQVACDEHSVDLKAAALRWLVYHSALDPAHGDKVSQVRITLHGLSRSARCYTL